MRPAYLDYNASTPIDPRVFEAMRRYYLEDIGNAGSRTHVYGQTAKTAVEEARSRVAALISAKPEEIVFTSGATESNNATLLGMAPHGIKTGRRHILTSAIEHSSVIEPLERLRACGFDVEHVPVNVGGRVELDDVKRRLKPETLLVSLMHANNETGVLQPVLEVGSLLAGRGTLFHVDAAQTFGKEVDELRVLQCDFLSISGHKIYGPQGIGALYLRRQSMRLPPLLPLMWGGGQEMGLRPGTIPVALVAGLGMASELARLEHGARRQQALSFRQRLLDGLQSIECDINGDQVHVQANVLNVSFRGVEGEALMLALRETVALSNGAACSSARYEQSHVLAAMGLSEDRRNSAVRFSWGPGIDYVPLAPIIQAVRDLVRGTV
jgi:cysteine desulfurase